MMSSLSRQRHNIMFSETYGLLDILNEFTWVNQTNVLLNTLGLFERYNITRIICNFDSPISSSATFSSSSPILKTNKPISYVLPYISYT